MNSPVAPLPARLWEQVAFAAGVAQDARWLALSRSAQHQLLQQLLRTEFPVSGKSLKRDEFVTCGGVHLREVNLKIMQSRVCPGLLFAGEVLDMDGLTGAIVPDVEVAATPGFQVPFAERIRKAAGIATAAVGFITGPKQADEIVRQGQADLVLLAREFLRDACWPAHAARVLGHAAAVKPPIQFARAW